MARRVLITGARAAVALHLARDFAAAGWEPHMADCVPSRMARWSNAPAQFHHYPAPRQQRPAFQARIPALVNQYQFDLVVPTCEEVFHLAAPPLHGQLGARLFAPDLPTLRTLHDKLAFATACADWGLPAPESQNINCVADLAPFTASSRDWVFKPRFSRFGDHALVAPSSEALAAIRPTAHAPWLAQRCIIGHEVCFYAIAHHGQLVAFAAYRSDWRMGGGASYAFEPLDPKRSDVLRELARQLAHSAEIHGQFACDVMFDAAGAPWLLECNPRATSGLHLLALDGHLARAISEGIAAPQAHSRTAYLAPAMLLFGLSTAVRSGRLAEWRNCLKSGHDVISTGNDRAPLAGALADATGFFVTGLQHKISTTAATTYDIEWNGEEPGG